MRKIVFLILYYLQIHKLIIFFKKKTLITLMLHRINHEIDPLWPSLTPKVFDKFINILKKNSSIISIRDFESFNSKKIAFILTFDDGYQDFYLNALPILNKYKVSANLNICPKLIDKNELPWTQKVNYLLKHEYVILQKIFSKYLFVDIEENKSSQNFNNICSIIHSLNNQNYINIINKINNINYKFNKEIMSWDEVIQCSKKNIIIGNHSSSHLNLDKLDSKKIEEEINKSKKIIENKINKNVNIFSLPNGISNEDIVKKLTKIYNYVLFSNDTGNLINKSNNTLLIDRINISVNNEYEEFFRALGFHRLIKFLFNFLFKQNNKS